MILASQGPEGAARSQSVPEGPSRHVRARGPRVRAHALAPALFVAVLCNGLAWKARGDLVILRPVADTTLIEAAPSNNLGGMTYVNSGTTQNFTRNRGLFRFDTAGTIPAGSWISNVVLTVEVVGQSVSGFTPADFGLYRMLRPWGEGSKVGDPTHPGLGALATLNEATWTSPFALTTNTWTQPGGAAGTDFAATPSSQNTIYGVADSPYDFSSTSNLVADVQSWVDRPADNFGWMLFCQAEASAFTSRRFGSREDALNSPLLKIEFVPPPAITNLLVNGGRFTFQFTSRPAEACVVEFRNDFAAASNWATLTNLPAVSTGTNYLVEDIMTNAQRFYRLRIPQ